jgi:hypothetical protein
MNANEISPRANARLNRIKRTSRALKTLFVLYPLVYFIMGWNFPFIHKMPDGVWLAPGGAYATISDISLMSKFVIGLGAGLILAAIISCYQLLNLYEKGVIFSARNVQLLGRIGCLAVYYGLLSAGGPVLMSAWNHWIGASSISLMNFHSLAIMEFFGSPWIIGGLFIVVISHIMDEGRKIQEKQELTV